MPKNTPSRAPRSNPHKISEYREAWTTVLHHELVLMHGTDEPDPYIEDYRPEDDIRILFRRSGRNSVVMSLSAMTEAELTTLRDFINLAVETALPIARELDTRAQEAFHAGDDAYVRLYRPVPQLYVRERGESSHNKSLPDRPTPVLGLRGTYYGPRQLGELRRRVADGESEPVVPEDNGSEADNPS